MTIARGTALAGLDDLTIEVPANSDTRSRVFPTPGTPRDPYEKIADAVQVHAVTGLVPRVSLHLPWGASTTSPPTPRSWA